jgi:hypothetical protein
MKNTSVTSGNAVQNVDKSGLFWTLAIVEKNMAYFRQTLAHITAPVEACQCLLPAKAKIEERSRSKDVNSGD